MSEEILKKVDELGATLKAGYVTNDRANELAKQIQGLQSEIKRNKEKSTVDPIFGDEHTRKMFAGVVGKSLLNIPYFANHKQDMTFWKTAAANLNEEDAGYGGPNTDATGFVPDLIEPLVFKLVANYGIARQYATFRTGVHGQLNLKARNVRAPVAYTTSGSPATSRADVSLTPSGSSYQNAILSPKQIAGIATVEEKLIWQSPIDVINETSQDLAESLALLEDQTLFLGDGTAAYGNVTGVKNNSNYTGPTLTNTNFASASANTNFSDALIKMLAYVHPSILGLAGTSYYMHPSTFSVLQNQKASGTGGYVFDIRTEQFFMNGFPIVLVNSMDAAYIGGSSAGQMPVVFGNLAKAAVAGTGRDVELRVLLETFAQNVEVGVRLVEDFGCGFPTYTSGSQPISKVILS